MRHLRLVTLVLAIGGVANQAAAQRPLNPTVRMLAAPAGIVPPECAEGTVAAAPRAEATPEPRPEPASAPSNELRAALRRVQAAAESDNYEAFKTALAGARAALASHPPGGERDAAIAAMEVSSDLGRLWDYAQASPTGSFFDPTSQNGGLLGMLKKYPGYAQAVADSTMMIRGEAVYPTRESRRFLAHEAAQRLTRLGVRGPIPVVVSAAPRPVAVATPAPVPQPKPSISRKLKPRSLVAEAKPKPKPTKAVRPAPAPAHKQPAPAAPVPVPAPVPASKQPAPAPVTTTTAPPAPVTTTAATGTTPPTTATTGTVTTTTAAATTTSIPETTTIAATDTAATDTTTSAPPKNEPRGGRFNLLLAIVFIVAAVGILFFLFRASD